MGAERTGIITLVGLRATGYHGVLATERHAGQEFVVDLTIEVDWPGKDDICDTVDYGELAGRVVSIIEGKPVNLIETVAQLIADAVLDDRRVHAVTVTVHKPDAPISAHFEDVKVQISRRNHD